VSTNVFGNLEILVFLGAKSRKKVPQIEIFFAKHKEILKRFRVLTTKLGQKEKSVQTP